MILALAIYAVYTIVLAGVDAIRINAVYGKKKNIRHSISWGLALIGVVPFVVIFWQVDKWQVTLWLLVGFVGVRFLFFDPMLNLFRHLPIDYVSKSTNSIIDMIETKLKFGFWPQRIAAAILIIISIFVK